MSSQITHPRVWRLSQNWAIHCSDSHRSGCGSYKNGPDKKLRCSTHKPSIQIVYIKQNWVLVLQEPKTQQRLPQRNRKHVISPCSIMANVIYINTWPLKQNQIIRSTYTTSIYIYILYYRYIKYIYYIYIPLCLLGVFGCFGGNGKRAGCPKGIRR